MPTWRVSQPLRRRTKPTRASKSRLESAAIAFVPLPFGAVPVFFRRTALPSPLFPIGVSQARDFLARPHDPPLLDSRLTPPVVLGLTADMGHRREIRVISESAQTRRG